MPRAWKNGQGEYLVISDISKWGMESFKYSFTKNLNKATICGLLPFHVKRMRFDLIPCEVLVVREVTLKKA